MKKSRGVVSLVLIAAVIGLLTYTSIVGFGATGIGAAKNIILGLDLAGGVSITYEAKEKNPSSEEMSDTIYKLQKRIESYSNEASVYQEGKNRINIEIPGVSDANAVLEELGKPGTLEFQDPAGEVVLSGQDVKDAKATTSPDSMGNSQAVVDLTLTEEGTKKFAEATQANIGKVISIVYDGKAISTPKVNGAITDGRAQITGMGDFEAAEELASTIRIGGLKLELEEIRSNVVGAQLGEEAISTSLKAAAIGLALVMILMCVLYLLPGLASSLALLIYVGLELLCLNAFDITLTLSGIAGIVLSIGMAVDANVIIFARVKEELGEGRSVHSALKTGFKKALSAIVDGNITTLLAAIVLYVMGSGSVRGFAQTLALGIVLSMITALLITRLIIFAFYAIGFKDKKFYGVQKPRKTIDFLSKRKLCFALSTLLIIGGLAVVGVNSQKDIGGFNYSLEFMGGTSTNITFKEDYSIKEIDSDIIPVVEAVTNDANINTQKVRDSKEVIIKTRTLNLKEREALNQAMVEKFGVDESLITSENISAAVSSEMRNDAVLALAIATVCMLIYIWFRFQDIRFAASSVLALLHDVLLIVAFYAVSRISVGNTFIACILTIVGYSINATIVIFDRIREEMKLAGKDWNLENVVNRSITSTLTRSIYTSITTFIMVAVLFIMGVNSIKEFAAPLMVGIIGGAYSSVCLTGALWYVMRKRFAKASE